MSNEVKIVYQKLTKDLKRHGYININHIQIDNKDKLAELGQIFRDPRYETFRIFYMKDNVIVGQEAISSKIPYATRIFTYDSIGRIRAERGIYKIKDRMRRLNANGYYMAHNHPTDKAKASREDIDVTQYFNEKIEGFKGHLIINSNNYAWIDIKNNEIEIINERKMKSKENYIQNKAEKNGIFNICIRSRKDIINLMNHIKNSNSYSTAIVTDVTNIPRMILDIPNKFLRMKTEQLLGYFQNISRENGGSKIFLTTEDQETYEKSFRLINEGVLIDSILYERSGQELYIYDEPNFEEFNQEDKKLFWNKERKDPIRVSEEQEKYLPKEEQIRVLLKRTNELPILTKIENTIEKKQEIIGGLIKTIPYKDALIIYNEKGKSLNRKPNIVFDYDYIAGDCLVVGDDYEKVSFKSLTDKQIEELRKDLIRKSYKQISDKTLKRFQYSSSNNEQLEL